MMKSLDNNIDQDAPPIRYCVDLSATKGNLFSVYNAMNERSENILNEVVKNKNKIDGQLEQQLIDAKAQKDFNRYHFLNEDRKGMLLEMAMEIKKFWKNGRILKVRFIGGNVFFHQKVIRYARKWEKHANIKFEFISSGDAEIRISFKNRVGSWSYVGTDNLNITDQNEPTMNFGWFTTRTTEEDFSCTILHEFGHALGCVHEHQSPSTDLDWNKPYVYKELKRTQNWSEKEVDLNVFNKYDKGEITNSVYDPTSIMHYPFPAEFFTTARETPYNSKLSATDIEFISAIYPKS